MAQTTIDFSSNIIDGTAGGGTGDNKLQVGDFIFTITAQGNWTANFNNGRFNFSEDASVGAENFSISITTASGDLVDFYDYQVSVSGTPAAIGVWPTGVVVDNVNWSVDSLRSGGPTFYRAAFVDPDDIPPVTPAASALIFEPDVVETTTSGTMSFWLDNITFETAPAPPNVAPSLTATGASPTFTENGAAVDLFSGVAAATNNSGQTFAAMSLTVSNVSNAGETLTVGGTSFALTNGASGTISGIGSYSVSVSAGVATITLSGMALSNSAMNSLVDGLSFSMAGDNPGSANRVVTIASITDSGVSNNLASPGISSTVHVVPTNDAPTGSATATLAHGTEDTPYTVSAANLLQGFSDLDGDTLTVFGLTASNGATVADNGDGTYTITPVADFNGAVTLSYSVIDGHGGSKTATQSFVFDAANDAPTGSATATLAHGSEDTPYTVSATDLLQGFTDIDGDTPAVFGLTASDGATVADNGDGTYTITPAADFNGTVTLSYSVVDGHGGSKAATQSFILDAANDAPTGSATETLSHGTEDAPYVVSATQLLQGFADADDDTLLISGLTASAGATVTDNGDGTYTITPAADFNGTVTLSYSVVDGHGGSIDANQSVTFDAANDAPVANDDTGAMNEQNPTAFDVLANDTDVDNVLSAINPVVTSNNGSVTINGDGDLVVSYTGPALDEGETAEVVVAYDATDGTATDAATLTVTVTGVYDPGEDIDGSNTGDTINGTDEGERINGFGGNDTINGRGGDDSISGGNGKDVIRGGAGNDNLRAGEGNDRIFGGKGNDRLVGWAGDDIMTGGKGRDTFVFHVFDGNDIVTDFHATGKNHDRIDLSAWSKFDTFAAVKDVMRQEGHSTVIDLPGDNSITLKHVDMDTLTRQDFLL